MPKVQTICPNCNQPLLADLTQVVDIDANPELKQALISGMLNIAQCQLCGFQGQIPVPMVYHDSDKELLLTFSPAGIGKTMEEKESALAPLLQKVVDHLPPEKRKGYLFQPQAMLTMNNLIKNVLEQDGITEEMIEEQQKKIGLLENMFTQTEEELVKTIQENEEIIDQEFFALFSEIAQRVIASQDESTVEKIRMIQEALLRETKLGRDIDQERKEIQAARDSLERLGDRISRQSLLDLVVSAPNEQRVKALVSLTRPAMDYNFFQMFTDLIEKSEGERHNNLVKRRNDILKWTQEIDQAVNQRIDAGKEIINRMLEEEDLELVIEKNLPLIDEYFLQALAVEMEQAKQENDPDRQERLETILHEIEKYTTPPELKVVEQLLAVAEDEQKLEDKVEEVAESITDELVNYLTSIVNNMQEQLSQAQGDQKKQLLENNQLLERVYKAVLRHSMASKMQED